MFGVLATLVSSLAFVVPFFLPLSGSSRFSLDLRSLQRASVLLSYHLDLVIVVFSLVFLYDIRYALPSTLSIERCLHNTSKIHANAMMNNAFSQRVPITCLGYMSENYPVS